MAIDYSGTLDFTRESSSIMIPKNYNLDLERGILYAKGDSTYSYMKRKPNTTSSSIYYNNYIKDSGTEGATAYFDKSSGSEYISHNNVCWEAPVRYDNTVSWERDSYDTWNSIAWGSPVAIPPEQRLRQMIQERMAPALIIRGRKRQSLSLAIDEREERARQTLRRILGEQAFRKFIRDGFITVVPKSGLTYRVYPGHGITEVYDRGIMVDRLCIVLQGNFPPTDSLIMRYLLILNDEGEFSKKAIKHSVWQPKQEPLKFEVPKLLTELWAEMAKVA